MSNLVFPAAVRGLTFNVMKTPEFNTLVQESPNRYQMRVGQSPNPYWYFTLIYDYLKNYPGIDYATTLKYTDLQTMMGFFMGRQGQLDDFLFTDPDDNLVGPAVFDFAHYPWLPNYPFVLGSIIIDGASPTGHAQQVTALTGPLARSGGTAPSWNHAGGTTTDSGLTWQDLGVAPTAGWPNTLSAQLSLVSDGAGNWYSPIQRNMAGYFLEDLTDLNPYVPAGQTPYQRQTIDVYDNGVLKVQDTSPGTSDYKVIGPGVSIPGYAWEGLVIQWHITPTGPITANFNFYFRVHFKTDQQDFEKFMQYLWTIGGSMGKGGKGTIELETSRIGLY